MPRPNTNAAALRRILQQELALGSRMAALAESLSQALVENDVPQVNALQDSLKTCLEQQPALESARLAATRDLAWGLGMERMPALAELIPALPVRDQEALHRLRGDLLAAERRLEALNQRNRLLLETALECTRFNLEALTSAVLQPARYGTNPTQVATPAFYVDSKA